MNGALAVSQVLQSQGVKSLFTLCGGHISPILVECKKKGIRIVDVRNEATAVFAAEATSRITGRVGVAAVTAGPGVTNTLTALQSAMSSHVPLVLIGGATATILRGRGSLQDVDQLKLVRGAVKWAVSVTRVANLGQILDHAFKVALSGTPGPVFVECPIDTLYDETIVRKWYLAALPQGKRSLKGTLIRQYMRRHLKGLFAPRESLPALPALRPARDPSPAFLRKVRSAVRGAQRPLLVLGPQALGSLGRLEKLAAAVKALGVPTYLTGGARGLLGRDHPLVFRHRRRQALAKADCVILAGVPMDFRLDYGQHIASQATVIAANLAEAELTLNRRPQLRFHGHPATMVRALATAMGQGARPWATWVDRLNHNEEERNREINEGAATNPEGLNPLRVCRILDKVAPANASIAVDGGDFVATAAYVLQPRKPRAWLDAGVFGTLGAGAGYALALSISDPDSLVVLVYGDGAAGYSIVELDTFVRHGLSVLAVVGNDASWAQIAREQQEILGDDVGTVLRPTAYHEVAKGLGAKGLLVRQEDEVQAVLEEAVELAEAGNPVLVNVLIGKSDFRKGSISM